MSTTTETKTTTLSDSRFKAVRRVRNRFNTHADREIGRFTRAIAASKDPVKIAVNEAKLETWLKAKALIQEVS